MNDFDTLKDTMREYQLIDLIDALTDIARDELGISDEICVTLIDLDRSHLTAAGAY